MRHINGLVENSHSSTSGWYYPWAWDVSPCEENEKKIVHISIHTYIHTYINYLFISGFAGYNRVILTT